MYWIPPCFVTGSAAIYPIWTLEAFFSREHSLKHPAAWNDFYAIWWAWPLSKMEESDGAFSFSNSVGGFPLSNWTHPQVARKWHVTDTLGLNSESPSRGPQDTCQWGTRFWSYFGNQEYFEESYQMEKDAHEFILYESVIKKHQSIPCRLWHAKKPANASLLIKDTWQEGKKGRGG